MAEFLSDADVGFTSQKLLSDADVGFRAAPKPTGMSAYREVGTEPLDLSSKASTSSYVEPGTEAPDLSDGTPKTDAALGKIANAAMQGWNDTPSILAQPAQDFLDQSPVGRQIVNPAFKIASAIPAGTNALMHTIAETVNQVTGDPRVGRDVMAALQVLPIMGGALPPNLSAAALARIPVSRRPQYIAEHTAPDVSELDPRNAISSLIQHDIAENPALRRDSGTANQNVEAAGDKVMQAPDLDSAIATARDAAGVGAATADAGGLAARLGAPEPSVSAPQSVGAAATPQSVGAASRDLTPVTAFGRSAREIKGAQADMELADLMKTPQPGDARDIIPGATQTKAEIELSPSVSRAAKGLRQEFREGFNEHEKANNELYHNWVDDVVPPREQVGTMKDLREANWQAREKTVFGPNPDGEPVSAAPIVQHLEGVFSDPVEKHNSYARKELQPFLDKLTNDNGDPIDIGAKELYGIRQEMGRKVKDMATNTDLAHLRNQFGDLMKVTDETITSGAPDYRTMMDEYREASIPINAAERLQDIKTKITNGSDRVITFGQLDRYMKSLWMERNGPNPYAPAKDIPLETWDHLLALHERLARSASSDELARTKGSDTTQMMNEMMRKGLIGAGHAAAAHFTGGLGNVAIPFITKQIDQSRALKKVGQHLNPDLSNYPPVVP